MHSYSIYTGISHVNQLTKIHPALIGRIRAELDDIALRFGGRRAENELYHLPPSLGETARKTAEAAAAMYACLREKDRDLYGITVLITGDAGDDVSPSVSRIEPLLLKVPDENGFWITDDVLEDFRDYLEGGPVEGLFRVSRLKEIGLRLEERLPKLLIRPERLKIVRQVLEKLELDGNNRSILLLRGRSGSGKRATLNQALRELYPDDGGAPLSLPFAGDAEDPLEPFIRALGSSKAATMEFLDEEEGLWWEGEGSDFLEKAGTGRIWETSRDQGPVDLIQAFALYLKAHLERRRRAGRPAYVVIDGFSPKSEAVIWLRSLLSEFLGTESFRLIIIRDSDDFDEALPIPGRGHEVAFRQPSPEEWETIVQESSTGHPVDDELLQALADNCGASLYRLFHALLARERALDPQADPGEALVESLDRDSRRLLFLSHAAAGLADRRLLVERLNGEENERLSENARYEGLREFGLIREDPDGRVRGLPGGPANASAQNDDFPADAEHFGDYLYRRYQEGDAIDLFRLFRYLETWGPVPRAIAVLDRLLESLLTNRRLRAAGLLLNGTPMTVHDLDATDMEALQNVLGAARLRFVLLTAGAERARTLVRDGTVTLIGGRGAYSERFRLHNARYSYAIERWDDALSAAKEALFTFQKSGDHEGETHSHLELALALLALGKVRDALEHFGIARRIGIQVSASWGVLRASALEVSTQFLFGNLPGALRDCVEYRETARRAGRRDLWLHLTLTMVRINWELGRYSQGAAAAEEGRRTAAFYGLDDPEKVLSLWKGRCLLALGDDEGLVILKDAGQSREALAFLAESSYLRGDTNTARKLIGEAAKLPRLSCRLQGEADDWSDGFFPVEGRLADSRGLLDVLGEWIEGFDAFLAAEAGDGTQIARLDALLETDGRRIPRPFSYRYALWAALASPESEKEAQTRYMTRAFNDFHVRAGRFDDNQTKHEWLSSNPWNKRLMAEAQKRKFL